MKTAVAKDIHQVFLWTMLEFPEAGGTLTRAEMVDSQHSRAPVHMGGGHFRWTAAWGAEAQCPWLHPQAQPCGHRSPG